MKITKSSSVNAGTGCISNSDTTCAPIPPIESTIPPVECGVNNAVDSINFAIKTLSEFASENPVIKESIANLAVVMFDLKSLK